MKFDWAPLVVLAAVLVCPGCQLPLFKQEPTADDAATQAIPPPAQPPQPSIEASQDTQEAVDLLNYFQRISTLPADELRKEYNTVSTAYQRDKTEQQRLRLALLLSVPGASFRDDAKLFGLLEAAPPRTGSGDANSPSRQLALVLQKLNAERVRQVREEQKRWEQLPRDDAKRVEELTTLNKRLEGQLADEKRRSDELQKKLDALITIERDLRSRSPQRRPN